MMLRILGRGSRYALRLEEYIKAVGSSASGVVNPDRKDPLGAMLGSIFTWQFVSKFAGDRLTEAWKTAQDEKAGLIVDDDVLRGLALGEHIYCESDSFRFVYRLAKPRRFDLGTFLDKVAKKYNIPRRDLVALAAESRVRPMAGALTKKVLPS